MDRPEISTNRSRLWKAHCSLLLSYCSNQRRRSRPREDPGNNVQRILHPNYQARMRIALGTSRLQQCRDNTPHHSRRAYIDPVEICSRAHEVRGVGARCARASRRRSGRGAYDAGAGACGRCIIGCEGRGHRGDDARKRDGACDGGGAGERCG